jgi:hypothetical protein
VFLCQDLARARRYSVQTVLTLCVIILKVGLAILCLFAFPVFAVWLQTTSNLELTKSLATYSIGAVVISLIIVLFRSLDKDSAKLLSHGSVQK